ncbi:hypothetical protein HMN09_01401000 [Mycena chlorophos]|uniref:F-box domain-containing protein n=1 Tax=Mycena chlorophos TaxID=658473 RepID=A0A8H6RW22_MYCCL|nr:hypothetical protein HMN09_01401000 [Mycena chlorophos]
MHRCLAIPEIAIEVAGHVSRGFAAKPTLAHMARTCRMFSGPALDELWRAPGQAALLHLARCLPPDFVDISGGDSVQDPYVVVLLRAFTISDWDRPALYARRIRDIAYTVNSSLYGQTSLFPILTLLATCAPGPHLFPRLTRLRWNTMASTVPDALAAASLLRLFLGPELQAVFLTGHAPTVLSLFPILVNQQLALRDVTLSVHAANGFDHFAQSLISDFTQSLHHARTVQIPRVDAASFAHLSRLPTLTELDVTQGIDSSVLGLTNNSSPSVAESYLALRSLQLSACADCNLLAKILPAFFTKSPLEDLVVFPAFDTTNDALEHLFGVLPSLAAAAAATLQRFELWNYGLNSLAENGGWTLPRTTLSSLRSFTKLTCLRLGAPSGFDFGDAAVGDLLVACPLLETLWFTQSKSAEIQFTLGVFLLVVRHAPSLSSLSIPFSTEGPLPTTYPTGAHGERLMQTTLDDLDVGYSPIVDPFPIAELFSSLFPELDRIVTDWPDPEDDYYSDEDAEPDEDAQESDIFYQRWKEVEKLAPKLAAIRKGEQSWRARGSE